MFIFVVIIKNKGGYMSDFLNLVNDYIAKTKMSLTLFSSRVEVDRSYLSQILNGKRVPSERLKRKVIYFIENN